MAKMNSFDRQHLQNLSMYQRMIEAIYAKAAEEAAKIAASVRNIDSDKAFKFSDYPQTRKEVDKLMKSLQSRIQVTIVNGIDAEWTLANNKNNELANRVFGDKVKSLSKAEERRYYSTNDNARQAFQQRKINGLSLSDRVWKYTDQFKEEIELGLDVGIRNGVAADKMAGELKQYLRFPNKLFRRVRDERGQLHLSQAAKAFHPGRGVYRSSFMNARRLAATETNMAYRTSDFMRWQQMDFVVGIEIQLSNNHTCKGSDGKPHEFHDICDELKGRYPKDFKFTGWHPHCRCHAVSILKTQKEIAEDTKKILNGEKPDTSSVNEVKDVPKAFKKYLQDNADRIAAAEAKGTEAYFIKDNPKFTNPNLEPTAVNNSEFAPQIKTLTPQEQYTQDVRQIDDVIRDLDKLGITGNKGITEDIRKMSAARESGDRSLFEKLLDKLRGVAKVAKELEIDATEELMRSEKFAENNAALSKLFGERGPAMDFESANKKQGNPNYSKSKAYKENCQSCVLANELRRRGFDVEALPYGKDAVELSRHTERAWLDKNGSAPKPSTLYCKMTAKKTSEGEIYYVNDGYASSGRELARSIVPSLLKDGRYHIGWSWQNDNTGHIITAEKIGNIVRFYDPQNGQIIKNIENYLKNMDYIKGVEVLYVSDLRVNPQIAKKVIQNKQKK